MCANIYHRLRGMLASRRPREVFNSDLKVRIDKAKAFRYEDFSGLCGPMIFKDEIKHTYSNSSLIIKVLFPPHYGS